MDRRHNIHGESEEDATAPGEAVMAVKNTIIPLIALSLLKPNPELACNIDPHSQAGVENHPLHLVGCRVALEMCQAHTWLTNGKLSLVHPCIKVIHPSACSLLTCLRLH